MRKADLKNKLFGFGVILLIFVRFALFSCSKNDSNVLTVETPNFSIPVPDTDTEESNINSIEPTVEAPDFSTDSPNVADHKNEADASEQETKEMLETPKQEQPKPAANGWRYKGYANFAQTNSFEVSFTLAEDKSEIRDLKIAISGLKATGRYQNSEISVNVTTSTTTFARPVPVQNNKVNAALTQSGNLSITFDSNGGATGTISYTFVIQGSYGGGFGSSAGNSHPDIPVDFGSSAIQFYRE